MLLALPVGSAPCVWGLASVGLVEAFASVFRFRGRMDGEVEEQASSSEKTGRWTDEEHTRFLHGLELFGKKWTKVADVVGSRTTVQVRSHAQKYFQKLEKDRAAPSGSGGSAAGRANRPGGSFSADRRYDFDDDDGTRSSQPIAVPPALRRFLPANVAAHGRAGAADVGPPASRPKGCPLCARDARRDDARRDETSSGRTRARPVGGRGALQVPESAGDAGGGRGGAAAGGEEKNRPIP